MVSKLDAAWMPRSRDRRKLRSGPLTRPHSQKSIFSSYHQPSSSTPKSMLTASAKRGYARPLAFAAALGVTGYGAYRYTVPAAPKAREFFNLPVKARGPDGKIITEMKPITYLAKDEAERKLTENAFSTTVPRAGSAGGVWRYETAFLASNNPIEDAHAQMVIRPSEGDFWGRKGDAARDVLFFAIMDGHGGFNTSRLLAKTLIPSVALELQYLMPRNSSTSSSSHKSTLSWLKSYIPFASSSAPSSPPSSDYPFSSDPKYVKTAIQTAFANLDSQIVNSPIKAVDELTKGRRDLTAADLDPKSTEFQLAVATLLPALSGSCALLAMVDAANNDLYVACTGDSRAVAGYWDVDSAGQGKWRVEVLTEDQTGRNPNEMKRCVTREDAGETC